ncbi:MAG: hypothetical protein CVU11_14780 [Bacteroidetes bacterium HGW-Bacteroidetes-6]|jgi:hypothetical protein|nr:MAG: hypothetical protein CVU11_14780 [Bacteroidetes bacterium HGW-Bacteroidetes-6]
MNKIVKFSLIVMLIAFIAISIFMQIRVERYLQSWKNESIVLKDRHRKSFLPVSLFYVYHTLFNYEKELDEMELHISLHEPIEKKSCEMTTHGFYDSYLSFVFYSSEEIDSIIKAPPVKIEY